MDGRYLFAGIRGAFIVSSALSISGIDGTILHTLDDRWGITPPWGACDSGTDTESPGHYSLRGWTHVDLGVERSGMAIDVPLAALIRSTWDGLEIYGDVTPFGIDAIVPLNRVGDRMIRRVGFSPMRDRRSSEGPTAIIQVGRAWSTDPAVNVLATDFITEARQFGESIENSRPYELVFPSSPAPDPFRVHEISLSAVMTVPRWTIDALGWLAELTCVCLNRAGVLQDVLLRIGALDRSAS